MPGIVHAITAWPAGREAEGGRFIIYPLATAAFWGQGEPRQLCGRHLPASRLLLPAFTKLLPCWLGKGLDAADPASCLLETAMVLPPLHRSEEAGQGGQPRSVTSEC